MSQTPAPARLATSQTAALKYPLADSIICHIREVKKTGWNRDQGRDRTRRKMKGANVVKNKALAILVVDGAPSSGRNKNINLCGKRNRHKDYFSEVAGCR